MPIASVGTRWSNGRLYFHDKAGNDIAYFDPASLEFAILSGAALDIESGGALKIAGTAVTASAAELNLIDTSVAGTAVASKAAVLGANKELDEFHTAALYLGAAAGTQITATAAEINKVAGVTGGTVSASKAVVTGANGALDFDGAQLDNVANANVIGGIPVVHRIDITAGALGNTDVTLTHKTRVIDAWLVLRGAGVATTTLQVFNGATAITDAMAASGSDKALVRAATIDDAAHEVAAAGTLRVTSATGASQPDATVYVLGVRVA